METNPHESLYLCGVFHMETRMDYPYVLPFQWCVCDMSVGINDVICLHTGHQKVARLLFGEVMGRFHIFGDSWCKRRWSRF